ncbi:elongation factor 1-beta 2-like [Capsicum annuum]|uniref:elongation factor 1-beta 2-like n=1 Tax=Capsicum annuum TaxID=4072 RepID=UPI001FB1A1A4|nr:elongation factor 1-beta 2-like [Capsicum annuum]
MEDLKGIEDYVADHLSHLEDEEMQKLGNDLDVNDTFLDIYPNASKYYQDISAKHAYSFPGKVVGVRFESQDVLTTAAPAKEAIKPANNNNDDNDIDLFREEIEKERRQQKQGRLLRNLPRRKQVKSHLFLWMLSLGIMKLT